MSEVIDASSITGLDFNLDPPIYYWSFWNKAGYVTAELCFLFYGAFSYFGIISYEVNGGDPQKRGLTNQLFSQVALVYLAHHSIAIGSNIVRCLVGWNSDNAFWIYWLVFLALGNQYMSLLSTNLLARFLTVVVYKRMPTINDDFMARFLFLSAFAEGFVKSMVACYCNNAYHVLSSTFKGLYLDGHQFSPMIHNPIAALTMIFGIVVAILAIFVKVEKMKMDSPSNNENMAGLINNWVHNKDVAKDSFVIFLFALVVSLPALITKGIEQYSGSRVVKETLTYQAFGSFLGFFVLPTLVYCNNKELRGHVKELYGF